MIALGGQYAPQRECLLLTRNLIEMEVDDDDVNIWRKRLTYRINELINDEAVCRTAPATPGLLKRCSLNVQL